MLTSELLGLLFRATVVMAIGIVAARLSERRSATLSHRILATTGLCIVFLPLVSQFGPRWEWTRPDWLVGNESALSALPSPNGNPLTTTSNALRAASPPFPQGAIEQTISSTWTIIHLIVALWVLGSLLMFTRLGVALMQLRSTLVNSCDVPETVTANLRAMASDLRISGSIESRISRNEAMPMVCWFGTWVLVLPTHFESWDEELRQATLAHELGHIARRDVWVDYGMQCLGCLLWWHPLIWMMTRDVTRLRELACDEWVLQSTNLAACSYAHSLLEVVRRCQLEGLQLATPMATRDELEHRLRSMSSPKRPQKIQRIWLVLCAAGIAILAYGISVVSMVSETAQKPDPIGQGLFGNDQLPSDRSGSTITGLVTHDGKPVSGIKVKLIKSPEGKPNELHAIVTTDDQGRYSIPGMRPGDRYQIDIQSKGELMVRKWQYQFPYVNAVGNTDEETIELPDAQMVSNTQVLKGIVVDPAGRPIPELTVTANLGSGEMLSRTSSGKQAWTRTDAKGRFTLTSLPDEVIELMTYKPSSMGGRIVHPCKMKVALNQKDIRIVFDPSLGSGIEDLDAN